MSSVSKNIKKLRQNKKLTQEEMAEKLFVTRQTVSNWENGKSQPDIDTLVKIAETFHTDATILIYGFPDSNNRKKEVKRLIAAAALLLVLGVGIGFLDSYARKMFADNFENTPLLLLRLYVLPLFWLVLGWTAIQGLGLLGVIKPVGAKAAKIIHIAVLSVVLFYAVLLLPYFIESIQYLALKSQYLQNPSLYPDGFKFEYNFGPLLTSIYMALMDFIARQPIIFVIPGLVFRFFKPSKERR